MFDDPLTEITGGTPAPTPPVPHLDDLIGFAKEKGLAVGSTTGGRHNLGSKHYTGNAVDIKNSGGFSNEQVAQLRAEAASRGFKVRDERVHPPGQAVWGGPHVHIEYVGSPIQDPLTEITQGSAAKVESDPLAEIAGTASVAPVTSRGAYAARAQQARNAPDTGMPLTVPTEPGTRPTSPPAAVPSHPLTGYDIAWHLGADPSEMKNWDPKVRKKAVAIVQQAVAEDARRRAAGQEILPPPLSRQNQIRAQAGLKPLAAPANLLPARDVPNLQDIVTEARQSPEAQTRANIRQEVLRKRDLAIQGNLGRTGALIGTPALGVGNVMDRINQVMSPIETVKNLLTPEEDRIDQEVQKQYEAQQRANTPEMIAERTARGEMSAPRRAIDDPVTRFGAGSAKMFAGIASLAGLAPNRVSEYLNAKGNLWDEATQLTPLTPEGKEVVRGLPEKITATLADMGIGIAQLVAMKKATGLSLSKIMALEAALKTSDAPLGERGQKVAEAATMGRILDGHLGRGASALLFGAPTAVQTGTAAIRGEMSPVEAILQTGLQAGVGAAMGGGEPKAEGPADLERAIPRRPAPAVPSEPVLAGLRAVDVRIPTLETAEAFSSPEGRLRAELEAAQAALPQGPLPKGTSRVKRERVRQQQVRVDDLQAQLDAIGPAQVAARQSQIESTRYSPTPRFDEWAENQTGQRLSQLDESEVQRLGAQYRARYGTEPPPPALREMSPLEAITGGSPDAISQREIQSRNQVQLRGIRQRSNVPTYPGEIGQESGGSPASRDRNGESGQVQQGQVGPPAVPVEPVVQADIPLTDQRPAFLHRDFGQVTESPNQKGVPKGRLRVVTEDGAEHLIKRPNGRGQGNNLAIPVRQVPAAPPVDTAPDVPTALQTPRQVIESAGFKYLGEQQFPKGRPSGYMFNVPDGSTLMMVGDVTPETLAAKIAEHAAKLVTPHPDPDVNGRANDVLSAAANGNLGDLSAAIREAPPEARAQLQGLAAEIAKERSSGTQTAIEQQAVGTGGEAGSEVPRPDQTAPNGPAGRSSVPGEPGASGAADVTGRPLTWTETMAEVQRRYGETGPTLTGGSAVFDVNKFPKGGLPDHAKILYLLDPVLTKLKADAASLIAAGKLKAEEVSAYIRDSAKDMFSNDPYLKAWNPINKRAGLAIIARETTPPSSTMDGVRGIIRKAKDLGGIEPIPQMSAAGIGGEGREHASARISVPFVVRDLLSRVFPDQYTDTAAMSKTVDIINKDNVLDGYDTFMRRGMDAQVKAATAEATEKAAIKHRKDLDKNPPAGLTPKDIGQLKMAANNAVNKAHNDAIDFRREAVGWLKDADGIAARPDFAQIEVDVNNAKSDPQIVANIARWKAEVNPEMDQLYNEAKRVDPNTPQPGRGRVFGARINLLPESRAAEMAAFSDPEHPMPEAVTSNYRNPNVKRDPFMREAKFTGEYSTDPQAVLTNSFGSRMNEVTKIRLVDAITSRGLGIELGPGEKAPDLIQGQKPVRLSLKMPVTNEQGTTTIAERSLWIRPDLAREVRDVLNTDMAMPGHPILKFLTQIQLAQATDITAHLKNVVSRLASAPMTSSAYTDAVRQLPLVGHVDALRRIVSVTREVMSDSPSIRGELAKISREGFIRPDYPAQGIQKVPVIGKVFRGGQQLIHTVDTAARISLYRAFDALVKSGRVVDTPENRAQYIQAIGEYNRRLISPWMRGVRDVGASPFIVAGKSFNRLGKRMLTGNPSVEMSSYGEAAKTRAANIAAGMVAGAVLPALLNMATTGALGGRPGTPIGAWDLGQAEDETGRHRVIDLFQIMGIRRGLRSTGANAAIEGAREGQSVNEITGHMGEDVVQASLHPWLGPGVGFGITALSGKRFDLRSSPTPIIAKHVGGGAQYAENARVALENQNPMLYAVLSPALGAPEGQEDDSLLAKLRKGITKGPASAFGVQDLKSPALKYLDEKIGATMPQVTASGDRQSISKAITTKERSGQSAADDLQRARTEGILSETDAQRLRKAGKLTSLEAKVENIHRGYGVEGVLDFYERFAKDLTPEERGGIQKILRRARLTIATHPLSQRGTAVQRAERQARLNRVLAITVPTEP